MTKISYAITVCNELEEIKRLLPFLIENKNNDDEIVILFDEKNGTKEVLDYLIQFNILPNVQTWRNFFENDFAVAKNRLNMHCKNEWIYQLDADEMIDPDLMQNLGEILDTNSDVDLIFVPRINIVNGITNEHIRKWGWKISKLETCINKTIIF